METPQPPFRHVLLVADERRPRVREVVEFLSARTQLTVCSLADRMRSGGELGPGEEQDAGAGELPVDLLLFAPAVRDELSVEQVDELLDRHPLAYRLLLVDNWLEGETRSGRAWPGVARLYWDQLRPQWELAANGWLATTDERRALAWRPPTWTAEDSWVAPPRRELPPARGRALVCGERQEARETLAEVCAAAGWEVETRPLHSPPQASSVGSGVDAIVFDYPMSVPLGNEYLRRLRDDHPSSRIVALIDFPRPQDMEAAKAVGADWVVGKPYRIEELLAGLAVTGR